MLIPGSGNPYGGLGSINPMQGMGGLAGLGQQPAIGQPGLGDLASMSPDALQNPNSGLGDLSALLQNFADPKQLRIMQLTQEIQMTEAGLQQAQAEGNQPAAEQLQARLQQLQAELLQLTGGDQQSPGAAPGGAPTGGAPGAGDAGGAAAGGGGPTAAGSPQQGGAPAGGIAPSGGGSRPSGGPSGGDFAPAGDSPTVGSNNAAPVGSADLGRLKTLQGAQVLADGSLAFKAGAAIDVDGIGGAHGDPYKQYQTSLRTSDGKSLNADNTPYFVLPPQVAKQYGIKPGDLGTISYNGKTIPAIFGDVGPKNKIGEVSRYAAQQLGINASPTKGGVGSGVTYNVFPGSGNRKPSPGSVTPQALAQRVDSHKTMLAQRSGSGNTSVAQTKTPSKTTTT